MKYEVTKLLDIKDGERHPVTDSKRYTFKRNIDAFNHASFDTYEQLERFLNRFGIAVELKSSIPNQVEIYSTDVTS